MTKLIQFESDVFPNAADPSKCGLFEIECQITCTDRDGADAEFTIESIQDCETKKFIELQDFSAEEQAKIERSCQQTADDCACDAYQSYAEGMADRAYDDWKDRMMDEDL